MVARIASPAVPDWAPTRVELPGSVSTYLPSLARSTSGVWCPRVGDPRSGSSRHRSSARICRAPWSDRPGRAPTGACPWTGRARLGSGRSDACRDRGGAAADRPAATTPGSTDRGRRRGAVVSAQPPTTGLRRSGRAEATTVLPTITVVVRGVGGKHPAEMSLACRWARSGWSRLSTAAED